MVADSGVDLDEGAGLLDPMEEAAPETALLEEASPAKEPTLPWLADCTVATGRALTSLLSVL